MILLEIMNNLQLLKNAVKEGSEGFSAPWPDCCGAFAADCLHWIRPKFQKERQCCKAGGAKIMRSPSDVAEAVPLW